jgi:hypothetical protein
MRAKNFTKGQLMEHSFDIKLAGIVGIEKAIILKNIHWWITTNEKNESPKHLHNGKYWTFNTAKAFAELFPYMKEKSIARWLVDLEVDEWLEIGNFNNKKYDFTKWYARGRKYTEYLQENADPYTPAANSTVKSPSQNERGKVKSPSQNDRCISQNERSNAQNERTIPDINTNINTDVVVEAHNDGNTLNRKDKYNFNFDDVTELETRLNELFLTFAPEIKRHFANIDTIKREMVDDRLAKPDCWKIIVDAFIMFPALPREKAHLPYLLKVIQGKKNDFIAAKEKTKKDVELVEAHKMRRDAAKAEGEKELKWQMDVLAGAQDLIKNHSVWFRAGEFERLKNAIDEKIYLRVDRICLEIRQRNEKKVA